jgi:hypothetical protein
MKKSFTIKLISSLLIFLFVYTALSKLAGHNAFIASLKNSPLLNPFAQFLSWSIPVLELFIAALLVIPKTNRTALQLSSVLLLLFTIYIGYMLRYIPNLPCSCGGVISALTWSQHLAFNIVFLILSVIAFRLSKSIKSSFNIYPFTIHFSHFSFHISPFTFPLSLFTFHFSLFTFHSPPLTTHHSLLITHYSSHKNPSLPPPKTNNLKPTFLQLLP